MAALGPIAFLLITIVILATDAPARLGAALALAALVWAGARCALRRGTPEDRAAHTAARAKAIALRAGDLGLYDAIVQNRIAPADLTAYVARCRRDRWAALLAAAFTSAAAARPASAAPRLRGLSTDALAPEPSSTPPAATRTAAPTPTPPAPTLARTNEYEAVVRLSSGRTQRVTVVAEDGWAAKELIERQYGKGSIWGANPTLKR
jgi:hypothetical protein